MKHSKLVANKYYARCKKTFRLLESEKGIIWAPSKKNYTFVGRNQVVYTRMDHLGRIVKTDDVTSYVGNGITEPQLIR